MPSLYARGLSGSKQARKGDLLRSFFLSLPDGWTDGGMEGGTGRRAED